MDTLQKNEITQYMFTHLQHWTFDDTHIARTFAFKTFVEAFSFMSAVALEAEKMDHHPDWSNTYNQVSVSLHTHSAMGVTNKDFDLAAKIDKVYKRFEHSS
jgi:4a-hydroxytetrahydrobiopterin dehydratase